MRRVPAVLLVLGACTAASAAGVPRAARGQEYVPTADSLHPRIRFADSLVSVNDKCPVTGSKLNTRVAPLYVNGRPIGFC